MRTYRQSGAVSRKLIIGISIPVVFLGLVYGCWMIGLHNRRQARAEWKTKELERLAGLSFTNEVINREVETLKWNRGTGEHWRWAGDNVVVMTNGEYLVYASRHGDNSGIVDHLFLAHGSDKRWYYSTYHFCNGMVGALSDDPPGSIAEFASRYSAREFDGKSDVCLQHTWPEKR